MPYVGQQVLMVILGMTVQAVCRGLSATAQGAQSTGAPVGMWKTGALVPRNSGAVPAPLAEHTEQTLEQARMLSLYEA